MPPLDDLFEAAAEIRASGARQQAVEAYHTIFRELEHDDDLEHREAAAYALVLEAHVLNDLGRFEDELRDPPADRRSRVATRPSSSSASGSRGRW